MTALGVDTTIGKGDHIIPTEVFLEALLRATDALTQILAAVEIIVSDCP